MSVLGLASRARRLRQTEEENDRLRALNAKLLAALDKIVELGHYPDESIARAAIDEAKSS